MIASGNQLKALKLYRTHTGAGLAQAKAFIDQLLASGPPHAIPAPELLDQAVARLTHNTPAGARLAGVQALKSAEESECLAAAALAQAMLASR